MVTTGENRLAKYKAKYDPEVVRLRYTATKELAEAKQETAQIQMAGHALIVSGFLNEDLIKPMNRILYHSFSNKLYGIVNRFGVTGIAQVEAQEACTLWICKGGVLSTLNKIGGHYGFAAFV